MRGKAVLASTTLYRSGITPAYAGKRDLVISGSGDIEDHPRVCGEKSTSEAQKSSDMGSPPRMRGKELGFHIVAVKIGITPACAGKRRCPRFRPGKTRDHPRVCGEKFYVDEVLPGDTGSTPRMRRKGEEPSA